MVKDTGWGEEDQCGLGIGASKFLCSGLELPQLYQSIVVRIGASKCLCNGLKLPQV
jgi:hypothetical protein